MKLSKLREITSNAQAQLTECDAIINASKENSANVSLQRKAGLAAARKYRIKQTISNYTPAFSVCLGDLAKTTTELYATIGVDAKLTCLDFHTNALGQPQANLFLVKAKNGEEKYYNLCKVVLEHDNQPLADVKINLLKSNFIKGFQLQFRNAEIHNELDTIAWETITKNLKAIAEEKAINKAIRAEEKAAKII